MGEESLLLLLRPNRLHLKKQRRQSSWWRKQNRSRLLVSSALGDSEAAELLAKAFKAQGEGLVELRRIETAEEIADHMAQSRNVVYLPTGQSTLLSLPQ